MAAKAFKVQISLDEEDAKYFRGILRNARKVASAEDPEQILGAARAIVTKMRKADRVPNFVLEAVQSLEDLTRIIEDKDWAPPKRVVNQVLAALAYFSNPQDLIPDDIPVLGFLDDTILIQILEEEFRHELWGYRRFRRFREGAEQRPWTGVARERLPRRLKEKRAQLRRQIEERKEGDARKKKDRFSFF